MVLGLDHVTLTVPSGREGEAAAFYAWVLGAPILDLPGSLAGRGVIWIGLGPSQTLHIVAEDPFLRGESGRHPAILVADVAPFRARLQEQGITILAEPDIPGWERFAFRDLWGNKVEMLRRDS